MTTILIVDDEFLIADILSLALEDEGYHTLTANSGHKALEVLSRTRPDLVITDYMMPGMTGVELATAIGGEPRHAHIPVMLMSGAQGYIGVSRPDLFVHVFDKPFDIDTVVSQIKRTLILK
jgi:CheY-like chemotaxis protein